MILELILFSGLIVTVVAIGSKVREHSKRIKEIEDMTRKGGQKK